MSADTARRNVRLLSWIGLATGLLGGLLVAFPQVLPVGGPWVQLGLGIVTLVLTFRARRIGIADLPDYDGRLSLAAAILGFLVVFFAGQAAWGVLVAVAN
jgi:hypothetical protein